MIAYALIERRFLLDKSACGREFSREIRSAPSKLGIGAADPSAAMGAESAPIFAHEDTLFGWELLDGLFCIEAASQLRFAELASRQVSGSCVWFAVAAEWAGS